ncbi:MAG: response regulator transcription factor [Phycisphaerae bacterium]
MKQAVRLENGSELLTSNEWQALRRQLALSPRELQVIQRICDDEKEVGIAANLGISVHTVHTHIERIYRKLGVSSRCALVVRIFSRYLESIRPVRLAT